MNIVQYCQYWFNIENFVFFFGNERRAALQLQCNCTWQPKLYLQLSVARRFYCNAFTIGNSHLQFVRKWATRGIAILATLQYRVNVATYNSFGIVSRALAGPNELLVWNYLQLQWRRPLTILLEMSAAHLLKIEDIRTCEPRKL